MTPRAAILALPLLLSLSAAAQLPRNEASVSAGWTEFADLGGARAAGASYARYWNIAIATEVGGIFAEGRHDFTDLHATVQLHVLRERRVSPWIGFGAARLWIDDPERPRSKFTPTGGAGIDVAITPRLALGGEFRYAPFEIDPRDRFGLSVNPTTFSLAARWRF